ncbi:MAG: IS701 family transposase [Actinobacteria bacterium]|nr:IS701 family transposase [Actinomycetota bacterium]
MVTAACSCTSESDVAMQCIDTVETAAGVLQPHFLRPEAYRHAVDYLRGLLADIERKNGWQLAEYVGYTHPRGIQRVLDRYAWDADAVRDDLSRWVIGELGDPEGVLVIDETAFPKQGRHSAGVARQYCGTLGKVANCQVGVFLGYASCKGHVGLDRALFLPREWAEDPDERREVGIPDHLTYRTKPELALEMVQRALDAGVPAAWVVGDEVYGSDGKLRRSLEERGQPYVLAVRSNQTTTTWPPYGPPGQVCVADLAAGVGDEGWQRASCGEGAQGPRIYDWALLPLRPALRDGWVHGLLLRRHPERTDEIAYYLVYAPTNTPLSQMVRAAGARWTIEDTFKLAKGQVGLDHYEVRSWHGWYHHITLALLALAALAVGAAKRGGLLAPSTSPSPSRRSVGSSSGSSGPPPARLSRSWGGPVGGGTTRGSPKSATGAAV